MGKASRKKNQKKEVVNHLERLENNLCTRCGKPKTKEIWCDNCIRWGHEIARGAKPNIKCELEATLQLIEGIENVNRLPQEASTEAV